jgi:hypothetical protein
MRLNETYINVRTSKTLSDAFRIQSGLKQDVFLPLLFNFPLEHASGRFKKVRKN